jgi:Tfp pilus assembly major pilin PilA
VNTTIKQSGFSIVEGAIAIVVVMVLGFIGWTVYNTYTSKPAKVTSQTTNPSSNNQLSKESTNATSATTQPTYLDIKEFGIKIPLDSSITDATYVLDPNLNSNPTEAQTVNITTKSLASVSNNKCHIQEITRTQDQNILGIPLVPNGSTIFKIGNYYYIFGGQQFVCSTDKSVQQLLFRQTAIFTKDFQAAQPDN